MPYSAPFELLKRRAAALDANAANDIAKCDVRLVAVLVDRYPAIVPAKYANCHIEAEIDASGNWVIDFDALRPRSAQAAAGLNRATA
jgi:hypothetical protein